MPGRPARRSRGRATIWLALLVALSAVACSSGDDAAVDRADASSTTGGASTTSGGGSPTTGGVTLDVDEESALRIGLPGLVSLDPAAASAASAADVITADLLYDTLTTIGDDGIVGPGLASFIPSADFTLWRFTLDQGATFADGTPVSADDVAFSLDRVLAGGGASLAATRLDQVIEISTSGSTIVEIILEEPSSAFPELLSSPLFAITDRETISARLAGGDVGLNPSGDYVAALDDEARVVLQRRAGEGPEAVLLVPYPDENSAVDAFIAGELDWTTVPPDRLGEAFEAGASRRLAPFHGGLFLGVDRRVAPLDNVELRRAIGLAIDRQGVVDDVFGPTAEPLWGAIPNGVPGAPDGCRGVCGPARDDARAIVERVLPEGLAQPLRLLVDDTSSQREVGGVIEDQLAAIGLDVQVVSLPVATYEQLIATGQQQLFLFGWLGVARSPSDHLPPLFDSMSPDNVSGLRSAGADAAFDSVLQERDPATRLAAWAAIEPEILGQAPVVPLVQFRTTGVVSERAEGLVVRVDGSLDLSGVASRN